VIACGAGPRVAAVQEGDNYQQVECALATARERLRVVIR